MPNVFEATDGGFLLKTDQFGLAGVGGNKGVNLEVAKSTGKGNVLCGSQRLVAEENDFEVEQAATQFGHEFIADGLGDVDTIDDATDGGPQLLDGEAGVGQRAEPLALFGQVSHWAHHDLEGLKLHALGLHNGGGINNAGHWVLLGGQMKIISIESARQPRSTTSSLATLGPSVVLET